MGPNGCCAGDAHLTELYDAMISFGCAPTKFLSRPLYHNLPLYPQTHQVEMLGEFFFYLNLTKVYF